MGSVWEENEIKVGRPCKQSSKEKIGKEREGRGKDNKYKKKERRKDG